MVKLLKAFKKKFIEKKTHQRIDSNQINRFLKKATTKRLLYTRIFSDTDL